MQGMMKAISSNQPGRGSHSPLVVATRIWDAYRPATPTHLIGGSLGTPSPTNDLTCISPPEICRAYVRFRLVPAQRLEFDLTCSHVVPEVFSDEQSRCRLTQP